MEIALEGCQVEKTGKDIFSLRNPCHRFNMYRVQDKDHGCQPASRYLEERKDVPKKQGICDMQKEVVQMIAEGPQLPKLMLQPMRGACEGVIFLEKEGIGPEFKKTLPRT